MRFLKFQSLAARLKYRYRAKRSAIVFVPTGPPESDPVTILFPYVRALLSDSGVPIVLLEDLRDALDDDLAARGCARRPSRVMLICHPNLDRTAFSAGGQDATQELSPRWWGGPRKDVLSLVVHACWGEAVLRTPRWRTAVTHAVSYKGKVNAWLRSEVGRRRWSELLAAVVGALIESDSSVGALHRMKAALSLAQADIAETCDDVAGDAANLVFFEEALDLLCCTT